MITRYKESRQARRLQERKQKKIKRTQERIEKKTYIIINNLLKNILSDEILEKIALKTKFQQRKRELTPTVIVAILLLGCSNGSHDVPVATLDTMCMYLRKWFDIEVTKQSLQQKLNRHETATFIKEVMTKVMSYEIDKVLKKLLKKRTSKVKIFTRILIQDSSVISLPETLSRIFRGCGGTASKAAIKCDYIIDQTNHLIVRLKCIGGRIPDASLSCDIQDHIKQNDLVLRDLGYFNLQQFSKIIQKEAYFLSRLSQAANIYLSKDDEEPLNLVEHLEKLKISNKDVDINVYLGKTDRIPVRLIGVKVPQEVVEIRRQQYKKARGKREPSENTQEWHGYTIMVTNIPRERLSLKSILKLYKVRWQIELFFKNMKSVLLVDELTGKNKYRILCLIFTKLAVTWVASILFSYAQTLVGENKQISRVKFTRWLKDIGNWKDALCTKDFTSLLKELKKDLDLLCMESKKSKKSEQKVDESIKYAKAA